jgi:hypothetical protein
MSRATISALPSVAPGALPPCTMTSWPTAMRVVTSPGCVQTTRAADRSYAAMRGPGGAAQERGTPDCRPAAARLATGQRGGDLRRIAGALVRAGRAGRQRRQPARRTPSTLARRAFISWPPACSSSSFCASRFDWRLSFAGTDAMYSTRGRRRGGAAHARDRANHVDAQAVRARRQRCR